MFFECDCMIPPTPRTSLFPSTTLFRSLSSLTAVDRYPAEPRFEVVYHLHAVDRKERIRLKCRLDRKSTRLNSSHANISYAVFCLQKIKFVVVPDRGRSF